MLKKILSGVVCSLLLVQVQAQRFEGNKIIERTKIGIHGGMSVGYQTVGDAWGWSDYYGDGSYNSDSRIGVMGGLDFEIPLKRGWYLQPEINYAQLGGKDYIDITDANQQSYNNVYSKLSYNYLQVPILFKYKPLFSGFGVLFGPQYSYLLNANYKYPNGLGSGDAKYGTYKSELSAILGLEYYIPNKNDGPSLGFGLRFQGGLTNIVDKEKFATTQNSVTNNGVYLTAGIRF